MVVIQIMVILSIEISISSRDRSSGKEVRSKVESVKKRLKTSSLRKKYVKPTVYILFISNGKIILR